jgi:hypothetical protein
LVIGDVEDCSGNVIIDNTKVFARGLIPGQGELLITEIMADPNPVVDSLPDAEYIELFNPTKKILELDQLMLRDLAGTVELPSGLLLPGQFVILTTKEASEQFSPYGKTIGLENFPSLNNSGEPLSLNYHEETIINIVEYSDDWYDVNNKSDGGYSLEMVDPSNLCGEDDNWTASIDPKGGTPGMINSVDGNYQDTDSPQVRSVSIISDSSVLVMFNERMDTTTLTPTESYLVDGLNIRTIELIDDRTVEMVFFTFIPAQELFQLTLNGIKDCSGNILEDKEVFFGTGSTPAFHDIVLTEIMSSPTPVKGDLPGFEYLEIFNPSDNEIFELEGMILADASTEIQLPSYLLLPGEYLIITAGSNAESLEAFGNVIGVSGFPTLNNSGDQITLFTKQRNLVFYIEYADDWYDNSEKANGGYALEMIDTRFPCLEDVNWTGSLSSNGGTPGQVNSVGEQLTDTIIPLILESEIVDSSAVTFTASKKLDMASVQKVDNYVVLEPGINILNLELIHPGQKTVEVSFDRALNDLETLNLRIENLKDCSGNSIMPDTLRFGKGRQAGFLEVLITEIMFDPTAPADADVQPNGELPEAEYLEIINTTNHVIDLEGMQLTDNSQAIKLPPGQIFPGEYLILTSNSNVSAFQPVGRTLGVSSFPSLGNNESLALRNSNGELVFHIDYFSNWLDIAEKSRGGFSLEMIDVGNPCGENNNWTASESEDGGTPGKQNSVIQDVPDNFGPQVDLAIATDQSQVHVFLNEKINKNSFQSANFNILQGIEVLDAVLEEPELKMFSLKTTGDFKPSELYDLQIKNITDCLGNVIEVLDQEVTFTLPEPASPGDVLISEVLFDPKPNILTDDADFVELYNNSSKNINLKHWIIGDSLGRDEKLISDSDLILRSYDFVVLTEFPDVTIDQYPLGNQNKFARVPSLPSFPNSSGSVAIIDNQNQQLDFFSYKAQMHSEIIRNREGVSLERISYDQPTNEAINWTSAVQSENFATPGKKNSQSLRTGALSSGSTIRLDKDDDGIEDKVFNPRMGEEIKINYNFTEPGYIVAVSIFNAQGRLVRQLVENTTVGSQGFFEPWDGFDDTGQLVRVGYYIILVNILDLDGNTEAIKKTVVVGSRL